MPPAKPKGGSRLAALARERRKHQHAKKNGGSAASSSSAASGGGTQPTVGLGSAPTRSATFDDSTISSKPSAFDSSEDGTGEESGREEPRFYDFTLPTVILSPSSRRRRDGGAGGMPPTPRVKNLSRGGARSETTAPSMTPKNEGGDDKPTKAAKTPRRRPNASYHHKLRCNTMSTASTGASTATASSASTPPSAKPPTPTRARPRTPKTPSASGGSDASASTEEQVRRLASERDKLRRKLRDAELKAKASQQRDARIADLESELRGASRELSLARTRAKDASHRAREAEGRLAEASRARTAVRSELAAREAEVTELEAQLEDGTAAEDELTRSYRKRLDKKDDELEALRRRLSEGLEGARRDMEEALREKDEEWDAMWRERLEQVRAERERADEDWSARLEEETAAEGKVVKSLRKKLERKEEELAATQARLHDVDEARKKLEATGGHKGLKAALRKREEEWKKELKEAMEERDGMEENWKMCLEELDRMAAEYEEKIAKMDRSTDNIENEKRAIAAEFKSQLTVTEQKLSELQSDKLDMERSLRDQVSDLTNELQLQRNSTENIKGHHSKVVEGLKSDLAIARKLREEGSLSLQRDMEEMKKEYDEKIRYYKAEVESLRDQLRGTKARVDTDRKERSVDIQRLTEEKGVLESLLSQAKNDVARLKTVRGEDIDLLESELDRACRSKVKADIELKDTQRQLETALKNLDNMAADGGQMRKKLEGAMGNFAKEKEIYQDEISCLKGCNERQKRELEGLSREKGMCEDSCKQLRRSVQELKDRLAREKSYAEEHNRNFGNCYELQQSVCELKGRLERETRANRMREAEGNDRQVLLMDENRHLKNKLKESEEGLASAMASSVASAAMSSQNYAYEISEQRDKIVQLQSENDQLREQISKHTESSAALRAAQRKTDAELSRESSQHCGKITQLQNEKAQLHEQIAQHAESVETLRAAQRETSAELSRAVQANQILKSKERYLESRVESLAEQISKTVQEYEMKLSLYRPMGLSASVSNDSIYAEGRCGSGSGGETDRQTVEMHGTKKFEGGGS